MCGQRKGIAWTLLAPFYFDSGQSSPDNGCESEEVGEPQPRLMIIGRQAGQTAVRVRHGRCGRRQRESGEVDADEIIVLKDSGWGSCSWPATCTCGRAERRLNRSLIQFVSGCVFDGLIRKVRPLLGIQKIDRRDFLASARDGQSAVRPFAFWHGAVRIDLARVIRSAAGRAWPGNAS
jgi:hypothetical protein